MYGMRRWAVRHARLMETMYGLMETVFRLVRPLAARIGFDRLERPMAFAERCTKRPLFDCHMCGACILTATGMACAMNCPKHVRNGPCGGVREDGTCEADPDMACVWMESRDGARHMRKGDILHKVNAPLEHHRSGKSSWLRLLKGEAWPKPMLTAAPHPSGPVAGSRLETLLREGTFVVTSECAPPDSADPQAILKRLRHFEGCVDALNVTDGPTAHSHMSSLGASYLLLQAGYEPVMQMNCRDRNRIAIQAEVLSAAALGVRNLLCITGDGIANGDDPGAKPVFDLDVVALLDTARRMRDDSAYRSGRKIASPPKLFLGAVDNPFMPPSELRLIRLEKKIDAGARFVQTQFCFDVPMLERYMARVRERGLHRRCAIIVGVGPIVAPRVAYWMRDHVPGVHVPDDVIARLEGAQDARREGVRMCIEAIRQIRTIEGVAGIHVMATRNESLVREIVHESGVLAGRLPLHVPEGMHACPSPA